MSTSEQRIDVMNPATACTLGSIPRGSAADVDLAVRAASAAAESWADTALSERTKMVLRIRTALEQRKEEAARTITDEIGSPLWFSQKYQVVGPLVFMDAAADFVADLPEREIVGSTKVVYSPVGVVAAITPFCFPLYQLVVKVTSALLAGCVVVLKPSELAPFNAILFAEAVRDAGLPAGVFNLLLGDGNHTGDALVRHPMVDMVSFTGQTATGRKVASAAAEHLKKITLGLSGRSANVLLPDADLSAALPGALRHCWLGSGQFCASASRLVVPDAQATEIVSQLVGHANGWSVGDPYDPDTQIGPLVSLRRRDRVHSAVAASVDAGARVLYGGTSTPSRLRTGAYVLPTILTNVSANMAVTCEELFAPVLTIQTYRNDAEAIELANATQFGLSGGVWSSDIARATKFAEKMRTGLISLNGTPTNVHAPFGGVLQSGYGKELGCAGIAEFRLPKALHGAVNAEHSF